MKKLSFVDTAFLMAEGAKTPMHVGSASLFTLPRGANQSGYLRGVAEMLRSADEFQSPFGDKLKLGPLGLAGPAYWEATGVLTWITMSGIPRCRDRVGYRELFALVSRLHGTQLDRSRPLWEMHLIEGLQNHQCAVYSKFHHAAIDGVRGIHLAQSMYSTSARTRMHDSPLSQLAGERYRAALQRQENALTEQEVRNVFELARAGFDTSAHLFSAFRQFSDAWQGRGGPLMLPWLKVPRSSINTPVDGARRFVAQSWPFERIREVGRALDGTFNDAVLAMCAGGLRHYLQNHSELPGESLKAMVPVSLRTAGDLDSSNAVAAISADLATNESDPARRFARIQASTRAGKALFSGMSAQEVQFFSALTQTPGLLLMLLGLASRFPPYSTVISNVPGPRQPMYWNGARLNGIYPASIVTEGVALNITLVTYDKNVDFGIVACRRTMPQVQRLIDYLEQSLGELEEAAGIGGGGKRPAATAKAASGRKSRAKVKAKTKTKAKAKARIKAKVDVKSSSGKGAGRRGGRTG